MTDIVTRVSKVITNFVNDEKSFTILDLSENVKMDGGKFVRHREVQPVARSLLDTLITGNIIVDYMFTDIVVNTPRGVSDARLYHPTWADPDDYTNRNQVASTPKSLDIHVDDEDDDLDFNKDDFNAKVDNVEDEEDDECSLIDRFPGAHSVVTVSPRSYDSRIEISKTALQTAGLLNEDVVITFHPNSIGIKKGSFGGDAYTTAKAGWRLGKSQLCRSNLDQQDVVIATFTDKIVIAKANRVSSSPCCKNPTDSKSCCPSNSCCDDSTLTSIEKTILELVKERIDYKGTINLQHKIIGDLGYDSLDIAELVMDIEDTYQLNLNDADFSNVKTVKDLADLISTLRI